MPFIGVLLRLQAAVCIGLPCLALDLASAGGDRLSETKRECFSGTRASVIPIIGVLQRLQAAVCIGLPCLALDLAKKGEMDDVMLAAWKLGLVLVNLLCAFFKCACFRRLIKLMRI